MNNYTDRFVPTDADIDRMTAHLDTTTPPPGKIASVLKRDFSDCKIFVEGHTDSDPIVKTKDKYENNMQLSMERARAVVKYLISQGVPESSIVVVGYDVISAKSVSGFL